MVVWSGLNWELGPVAGYFKRNNERNNRVPYEEIF